MTQVEQILKTVQKQMRQCPATPKSTTSAASTVTSGLISMPSTTDSTLASSSSVASSGVNSLISHLLLLLSLIFHGREKSIKTILH